MLPWWRCFSWAMGWSDSPGNRSSVYAAFAWQTVLVAVVAAVVVGVKFGMYPALRAARLSPIDAIRHE